jgi:hypothetical protein
MKFLKRRKYGLMSNILKYSFVIVFALMLITPVLLVNAVFETGDGVSTGTNITTGIENPLGQDGPQDIPAFIRLIVRGILYVGVPIVALAIIYTGFLFVEAQGNPEKITKAKKALTYTLIGAALLLGAFVVAEAIQATVEEITSTT